MKPKEDKWHLNILFYKRHYCLYFKKLSIYYMYDFRNHNVIFKMLIFFQCRKKEDAPTADTEEVEDAF